MGGGGTRDVRWTLKKKLTTMRESGFMLCTQPLIVTFRTKTSSPTERSGGGGSPLEGEDDAMRGVRGLYFHIGSLFSLSEKNGPLPLSPPLSCNDGRSTAAASASSARGRGRVLCHHYNPLHPTSPLRLFSNFY